MGLFSNKSGKLIQVKELKFDLEKDLQTLTENNLDTLFGLEFVGTEFQMENFWIDTLAFDPEAKAFVIIEYKRDSSFSIVDQGFSYLSLVLNHKADLVLEYNEKKGKNLKRSEVDWSQTRIIFVAKKFTAHQKNAINFKNSKFELWEANKFEEELFSFSQVDITDSRERVEVPLTEEVKKVVKQVVNYSEEDVLGKNQKSWDLYKKLKEGINQLDEKIVAYATKYYIGFKFGDNWRVFISVQPHIKGLLINLTRSKPGDYKDPEKKLEYIPYSVKNYGQDMSKLLIDNDKDLIYALMILKQAYDRFAETFISK